jgi:hypothetical protein
MIYEIFNIQFFYYLLFSYPLKFDLSYLVFIFIFILFEIIYEIVIFFVISSSFNFLSIKFDLYYFNFYLFYLR